MPNLLRWSLIAVAVITIPLVLLGALMAGHVYSKEICPICGQSDSSSGFQFLGVRLTGNRTEPGQCLATRHRWVHGDGTRRFWWKKGYSHGRGVACGWDRAHRLLVGPWLRVRGPTDPQRVRVIAAIEKATIEDLSVLLSSERILSQEGAIELLASPPDATLDKWANEFILPWAASVLGGQRPR